MPKVSRNNAEDGAPWGVDVRFAGECSGSAKESA